MNKKLTEQEKAEQELADKVNPVVEKLLERERTALEFKRGKGITLEENEIVGERLREIEKELS